MCVSDSHGKAGEDDGVSRLGALEIDVAKVAEKHEVKDLVDEDKEAHPRARDRIGILVAQLVVGREPKDEEKEAGETDEKHKV